MNISSSSISRVHVYYEGWYIIEKDGVDYWVVPYLWCYFFLQSSNERRTLSDWMWRLLFPSITLGVELTYPTPDLWKYKNVVPSTFSSVERKKISKNFTLICKHTEASFGQIFLFSKTNSFHVSEKWLITWPTVVKALLQVLKRACS